MSNFIMCKDCVFFGDWVSHRIATPEEITLYGNDLVDKPGDVPLVKIASCRRYPPTPNHERAKVEEIDFCGEFLDVSGKSFFDGFK